MKHSSDNERGQAIVILALAMIVLLLFAGLAIDGGNAYVERRRSQNAADAAALAGARQLWMQQVAQNGNEADLLQVIYTAAVANGVAGPTSGSNPNVEAWYTTNADGTQVNPNQVGTLGFIPPNVTGLRVKASRQFSTFVGGFLRQSPAADAQATAIIVPPVPCSSWAIYATGSQSCPPAHVSISGGGQGIHITNGGVYSGGDMQCDTSKATVDAPYVWEYAGSLTNGQCATGNGSTVVQGTVSAPPTWDYNDFLPGGPVNSALGSDYHAISDHTTITTNGLYFVNDTATHLSVDSSVTHLTIVANGEIQFSGGINLSPFYSGLLLFSNAASGSGTSVKISGSNLNWQGLIYAPNGSVDMSASANGTIGGQIYAACVDMSGAEMNINYDPGSCAPQRATIKLLKFGE